jgi:hypothetical protein
MYRKILFSLFLIFAATFAVSAQVHLTNQASDPKTCVRQGDFYYNTATKKYRYCTLIGTPGTWADLSGVAAAWGGISGTIGSQSDLAAALAVKQALLVSGTNIKTINGSSVLGSGDLAVSGEVETLVANGSQLDTAITTANSNPTIKYDVRLTTDITVSVAKTIPANAYLEPLNGKLVKSGTGAIACQGICLRNAESTTAIFSGFAPGDVTWTGTLFPPVVSTSLWDNANWSDRCNAAFLSLPGKQSTIKTFPADFNTTTIRVTAGHSFWLTRGDYRDVRPLGVNVHVIIMESNTTIYGDGEGQTIWHQPAVGGAGHREVIVASGITDAVGLDGYNENLTVHDFSIVGDPTVANFDDGASVILLGNVSHCLAEHIHEKNVIGYGIYVGGFPTLGYHAYDCKIINNTFDGVRGQNTGTINGTHITIAGNHFIHPQPNAADGFISQIDIEPNTAADLCDYIDIHDNDFDNNGALVGVDAIFIQPGGNDVGCRNVKVSHNYIVGGSSGAQTAEGIVLAGVDQGEVSNNYVSYASQSAFTLANSAHIYMRNNSAYESGTGGVNAYTLGAVVSSFIDGNMMDGSNPGAYFYSEGEQAGGTVNTSSAGNTVTRTAGGAPFFAYTVGLSITINSVNYTIATVTDSAHATLTTNPGNQTGVSYVTNYTCNTYSDNLGRYAIRPCSRILNTKENTHSEVYNPGLIATVYNDWNAFTGANARIYKVTSDNGSRGLTGFTLAQFPSYYPLLDGDEHIIINGNASFVSLYLTRTPVPVR